ncbi:MAG: hypothetical protein ACREL3_07290 [Gemmatimonadales bacterium]
MEHRGAEGADPGTADEAGVLLQLPDRHYRKAVESEDGCADCWRRASRVRVSGFSSGARSRSTWPRRARRRGRHRARRAPA